MASSLISNPVISSDRSRESSRRKKKKRSQPNRDHNQDHSPIKWKSEAQQQIYSSKLVQALRQVRLKSDASSPNEAPRRGRAVREAADRVLAVSARGKTIWSRAILTNRLKLKFSQRKRQRNSYTANNRSKKPRVTVFRLKGKSLPAVQKKVRLLGRLVPGCRKQSFPVILEEATDYIAALEMQVRALAQLLSPDSGSSYSPPT